MSFADRNKFMNLGLRYGIKTYWLFMFNTGFKVVTPILNFNIIILTDVLDRL